MRWRDACSGEARAVTAGGTDGPSFAIPQCGAGGELAVRDTSAVLRGIRGASAGSEAVVDERRSSARQA